jgi:hypothetical protein
MRKSILVFKLFLLILFCLGCSPIKKYYKGSNGLASTYLELSTNGKYVYSEENDLLRVVDSGCWKKNGDSIFLNSKFCPADCFSLSFQDYNAQSDSISSIAYYVFEGKRIPMAFNTLQVQYQDTSFFFERDSNGKIRVPVGAVALREWNACFGRPFMMRVEENGSCCDFTIEFNTECEYLLLFQNETFLFEDNRLIALGLSADSLKGSFFKQGRIFKRMSKKEAKWILENDPLFFND